jgi:hypothetical protein
MESSQLARDLDQEAATTTNIRCTAATTANNGYSL